MPGKMNMANSTILTEITQSFISNVKSKEIIKNEETLNKFSQLFNDGAAPTVEQLKNALFHEELS